MARIRTIKPEFWTDIRVIKLSIPARLFFIGLWNFADDNGVLIDNPEQLGLWIFPRDDLNFDELLNELEKGGLILRYEKDGEKYIWIKNFAKHQKIDRPRKSTMPLPDKIEVNGNQMNSVEISRNQIKSSEISRNQMNSVEISPGKERKGKESNIIYNNNSSENLSTKAKEKNKISEAECLIWVDVWNSFVKEHNQEFPDKKIPAVNIRTKRRKENIISHVRQRIKEGFKINEIIDAIKGQPLTWKWITFDWFTKYPNNLEKLLDRYYLREFEEKKTSAKDTMKQGEKFDYEAWMKEKARGGKT